MFLEGNDETKIKIVGENTASGSFGSGFYGDVEIIVYSDFGTISYKCAYHGYMGGQNNLVFSSDCEFGYDINTPTPTLTPTQTPTPTITSLRCASSPITITVESEYIGPGNSVYKYITSDSNGNGGLFGCINVERGSTLTIFVDGDEPNLLSHPIKITHFNDQGQAMAPVDGVVKTDLTSGATEDHTYSLTWVVPCDESIDKYQYQCENHAGMRGTINVSGDCPTPTSTPTQLEEETPTPTQTPTPTITSLRCASSPITITVESEYIGPGNSVYKYITSDSNGNGGLFGCINVERGSTLTIFVDGDEPNLLSHPIKITHFNDQGQAMAPVDGVVKTDLTSGATEDHTYSLTWVVPCDESIDKYQYQCENHAGMRGTINVSGDCPTPTSTPTQTPIDCLPDISTGNNKSYSSEVQVTHIGGGTFEWCGGTVYADPGLLPLKDLCDETELTLENGGIEVLYFDSSGELPITNLTEIEKLGLLVPIELDNGTTIGPDSYTFKVKYKLSYNNQTKIGGGRNITVKDCSTPTSTSTPTSILITPSSSIAETPSSTFVGDTCISGFEINNDEIYHGVQLTYSSGSILVDSKDYSPTPSLPTIVYIYINNTNAKNFCGKITVNSRIGGIGEDTFNNTIVSYKHSNGLCYNRDLSGIIGDDNHLVFGTDDGYTSVSSCSDNLITITENLDNKYGIKLSDSNGSISFNPKNYTPTLGLPVTIYIYIDDASDIANYRGKLTINNRIGGLTSDAFNSDEIIYIDSDNKCYKTLLSDINATNNIKIFNTYN